MMTEQEKEVRIYKITLDELNKAYDEVKRIGESSQKDRVKAVIARDPVSVEYHNLTVLLGDEPFPAVFTLDFIFDYSIGTKGRWVIDTRVCDVEVIDIEE